MSHRHLTQEEIRKIWKKKKILRLIYLDWFRLISGQLLPGKTFEVAAGAGFFKDFKNDVVNSDIVKNPWVDISADATNLPLDNESYDNIVCIDGLHHMPDPLSFLKEAERVVRKGGRVVIFEPYNSPFSYLVRKIFHHEDIRKDITTTEVAEEGNLSTPNIIFVKQWKQYSKKVPRLRIIRMSFHSLFAYPLSGGFNNKSLISASAYPLIMKIENLFRPLIRIFGFKMLVVLEKK